MYIVLTFWLMNYMFDVQSRDIWYSHYVTYCTVQYMNLNFDLFLIDTAMKYQRSIVLCDQIDMIDYGIVTDSHG